MVHSKNTSNSNSFYFVEEKYSATEVLLEKVCDQMETILEKISKVQQSMLNPDVSLQSDTDLEYHLSSLKRAYNKCYRYAATKSSELENLHFQREIERNRNKGHLVQAPSMA